jgi:hypothetical protein
MESQYQQPPQQNSQGGLSRFETISIVESHLKKPNRKDKLLNIAIVGLLILIVGGLIFLVAFSSNNNKPTQANPLILPAPSQGSGGGGYNPDVSKQIEETMLQDLSTDICDYVSFSDLLDEDEAPRELNEVYIIIYKKKHPYATSSEVMCLDILCNNIPLKDKVTFETYVSTLKIEAHQPDRNKEGKEVLKAGVGVLLDEKACNLMKNYCEKLASRLRQPLQ